MPTLFKRFTEKEAKQWRQIYKVTITHHPACIGAIFHSFKLYMKELHGSYVLPFFFLQALVLLEYLVKNGAERVVDEARSHMATIKILRNFHFIDEKGKDQGINGKKLAWTMLITNGTKLTLYEILTST
jgi:epsin